MTLLAAHRIMQPCTIAMRGVLTAPPAVICDPNGELSVQNLHTPLRMRYIALEAALVAHGGYNLQ